MIIPVAHGQDVRTQLMILLTRTVLALFFFQILAGQRLFRKRDSSLLYDPLKRPEDNKILIRTGQYKTEEINDRSCRIQCLFRQPERDQDWEG